MFYSKSTVVGLEVEQLRDTVSDTEPITVSELEAGRLPHRLGEGGKWL